MKRYIYFFAVLSVLISSVVSAAEDADPLERVRGYASDPHGGVVLVLSGGGTKGFAHIGVLKVLEEMRVPVVGIVGTSIGSVIGGLYASGIHADRLHEIIKDTDIMELLADSGTRTRPDAGDHFPVGENGLVYRLYKDKRLGRSGPLGLLSAMSLVSFLNQHTEHVSTTDFMKLPIPFACVATDLSTGEAVVLKDGSLSSSIRASVSIPGLIEPWPIDGRTLVDGGLVANLPVEIAKELFPGRPIIAVNLSSPNIERPMSSFYGMVDVVAQMIEIMTIDKINDNAKEADLVIYPDVSGLSMLDATGYDRIYGLGVTSAAEAAVRIAAIADAAAPAPKAVSVPEQAVRYVRSVKVTGVREALERDIQKYCSKWIGNPYDAKRVNRTAEYLMMRDDIATADVDILPAAGLPGEVDIVFNIERRPSFEMAFDGYSSNLHSRRWVSANATFRDMISEGDTLGAEGRFGNEEWGAHLRYFTPMSAGDQWGFALSAAREWNSPYGMDSYSFDRYSGRIMRYHDGVSGRLGYGLALDSTNIREEDGLVWGPYIYYTHDSLDNTITPRKGVALDSRIWWNSESIWVSHTRMTAYIPTRGSLSFKVNMGLKTGEMRSRAYRALLGSNEELFSLARHPYAGDQAAWVHAGAEYEFYKSWWGALRGELFAAYGIVMEDWSRQKDAWETGLALSVPGQFFNGRLLFVYGQEGEFTVGFTIGKPSWWSSPLP